MKEEEVSKTEILKVIVGSQAHGLATLNSDTDYRGVYVVPTEHFHHVGAVKVRETGWVEGKDDDTSWEIGKFLFLATKCNPTILECFLAPVKEATVQGYALRELFPYIWSSKLVRDAFIGYGLNQRKKFLEDKDGRKNKFAAAYVRSLYNGWELLNTGTFTIKISDIEIGKDILRFKNGEYEDWEVIKVCLDLEKQVRKAYDDRPKRVANLDKVSKFILDLRANCFWAPKGKK